MYGLGMPDDIVNRVYEFAEGYSTRGRREQMLVFGQAPALYEGVSEVLRD
jgi:hypothetical protein